MEGFVKATDLSDGALLPTFSDSIDQVIGGGFLPGCLTEIAGQSGVGKTQLCLQLCANVQLPEAIGGLEGESVYLDCNGGFSTNRLAEICRPTKEMGLKVMKDLNENVLQLENQNFLNGVIYRRIGSIHDFQKALNQLVDTVLQENDSIKLLIVDSIAFHFRYPLLEDVNSNKKTTATLQSIAQKLQVITNKYNLVTIVTNQMTTRMSPDNPEFGEIIPALGESWSHACSNCVLLDYVQPKTADNKDSKRIVRSLKLIKSSKVPCTERALYCITSDGIRDTVLVDE